MTKAHKIIIYIHVFMLCLLHIKHKIHIKIFCNKNEKGTKTTCRECTLQVIHINAHIYVHMHTYMLIYAQITLERQN